MKLNFRKYSLTILLLCLFNMVGNYSVASNFEVTAELDAVSHIDRQLPELSFFHKGTVNRELGFIEFIEDKVEEDDETNSVETNILTAFEGLGLNKCSGEMSAPSHCLYTSSRVLVASATKRYIFIQVFRI